MWSFFKSNEEKMLKAAKEGYLATVKKLIAKDATLINCQNEYGHTPFHVASLNGQLDVATFLVSKGASIDQATNNGETPLYWTSLNGQFDVVKFLLSKGANIDQADNEGRTPLYRALDYGHFEVVKLLLSKGASIDQADNYGVTPLHYASLYGHLEIVRVLVDAGASLVLVNEDGNTAKDYATQKGHSAVGRAQLRLSVPSALTANKIDEALASLDRFVPPTGCQNATDLVYRAVAYICVGKKVRAWKDARASIDLGKNDVYAAIGDLLHRMNRFDVALEVLAKGLESADTKLKCNLAMHHVELSKRVAVAFDASMVEITVRLAKVNPEMLQWLDVPENQKTLNDLQSCPYKFNSTDLIMNEVLKILEDPLKRCSPVQNETGYQLSSDGKRVDSDRVQTQVLESHLFGPDLYFKLALNPLTLDFLGDFEFVQILQDIQQYPERWQQHLADRRMIEVMHVLASTPPPCMDVITCAFGTNMISKLASNPRSVGLIADSSFLQKLQLVQQDLSKFPQFMDDARMGTALVALLKASRPKLPTFDSLKDVVSHLRDNNTQQWPLMNNFVLCAEVIASSNHSIFRVINTAKPHEDLVAKLTQQQQEISFLDEIHRSSKIIRAMRHIVKCEAWGPVSFDANNCFAIIMERGLANCKERLPRLQQNDFRRFSSLKEILDAIGVFHDLGYIHGDIKLENVVYFGDEVGYKLIDFDNTAKLGTPMTKHCTEQYCPPEMAKYILGHSKDLQASTAFDVWCAAVLVLHLFVKPSDMKEFINIADADILESIASSDFSFQASIDAADLSARKKKILSKCLSIDPAERGTLQDLECLLPTLKTTMKGSGLTKLYEALPKVVVNSNVVAA
ncbi:Aste57867_23358 [Aphanomyces stellatus]|uniref:Aste57867_23358 protein n=1 Tax=Aphanomyces stellatus TaxID=120398 RepID=A0A485LNI6_9STRA|nr:hypothetical protein As57867_023287 [Aphanomyces stellatus]VFU00004.1 Aste57867_23358 [Aphanomyces stellatus]